MNLARLGGLLRAHAGLELALLGEKRVEVAARRLAATLALEPSALPEALALQPEALQALVEAVMVHETFFFRDEAAFDHLAGQAQAWRARTGASPLRLLSLGCATGEEAYSAAITLLEAGLPADAFRVEACDISAQAIAQARAGVYRDRAFRSDRARSAAGRWCAPVPGGHRVGEVPRQAVCFHQANLNDPAWRPTYEGVDVIFCRNVLIYFEPLARARLLERMAGWLATGGQLFAGHSEATALADGFDPAGPRGSFVYRRRQGVAPVPAGRTPAPLAEPGPAQPRATPSVAADGVLGRLNRVAELERPARRLRRRGALAAARRPPSGGA